jgi:hypothetical protein
MFDLFKSKKFQAALVGVFVTVLVFVVPGIPEEALTAVLTPIIAYILGQGLADLGKEAAKIKNGK